MSRALALCCWALCLAIAAPLSAADDVVEHDLEVRLEPESQSLTVSDRITLPREAGGDILFYLYAGLEPSVRLAQGEAELILIDSDAYVARYRLRLPAGAREFRLDYRGRLHHELEASARQQARGFSNSAGLIDSRGSFLSASSLWYAQFEDYPLLRFDLRADLPADWLSVSQGERLQSRLADGRRQEHWRETRPQQEIYLIAAAFELYSEALEGGRAAQVFLRSDDAQLAGKYLAATANYIAMYEKLLGPYPYRKFALVENFWETGFGMPSFTLLGSRVIRLPFIINSSYPHEILHNWWGNGVYVDFAGGNWSEGLTAYLADHLIKQQQGQAAPYRQQSLQKYRDYAASGRDFALREFRGRHSPATEAVGYGKTMMLFHMLRQRLGDETFTRALQRFYADFRFAEAGYDDLANVFSDVAGTDLGGFFEQWIGRVGAPELALTHTRLREANSGFRLEIGLEQRQPGEVYALDIPLAVSAEGRAEAIETLLSMNQRKQEFVVELSERPLRIDIDPGFDLFRTLALAETPPAFTQLFGARDLLVVLPRSADAELQTAWQRFARGMQHTGPERVEIVWDDQIERLPADRAVAVLGWGNRFGDDMRRVLEQREVGFDGQTVRVGLSATATDGTAFAWVTRAEGEGAEEAAARAWITADLAAALPGLLRKLPHYHKYSYLAFTGDEPQNSLKGRWPVTDSPLTAVLEPGSGRARLASRPPLIEAESSFSSSRMMEDLRYLSAPALAGRGFGEPGLEQAASHIAAAMQAAGLEPGGGDGGYFQHFDASGGADNRQARLKNVVAVIPGSDPKLAGQSIVVGAHYDHLGNGWPDARAGAAGQVHHGADDNASGVAVLLELARVLGREFKPSRSVVFVAFSAEEAGRLGSRHYVEHATAHPAAKAIGMLNLDSVGRLFDDKLLVLGAESASEWPHIFRGIGFVTGIQTVMVSEALDASDQASFHEAGVPAVQLFSGVHEDYHRPGDTADKIDADGLVKVAEVGREVIEYLATREEALSGTLSRSGGTEQTKKKRRVSLGTVPDFTYGGEGYRLDGVVAGSPAEKAGLRQADVITAIDGERVGGVRDLSRVLKSLAPGQSIEIRFRRQAQEKSARITLDQR